jgi:hypothetical protein
MIVCADGVTRIGVSLVKVAVVPYRRKASAEQRVVGKEADRVLFDLHARRNSWL